MSAQAAANALCAQIHEQLPEGTFVILILGEPNVDEGTGMSAMGLANPREVVDLLRNLADAMEEEDAKRTSIS